LKKLIIIKKHHGVVSFEGGIAKLKNSMAKMEKQIDNAAYHELFLVLSVFFH